MQVSREIMRFTQNETKKLKYHINSFFLIFYFEGGGGWGQIMLVPEFANHACLCACLCVK